MDIHRKSNATLTLGCSYLTLIPKNKGSPSLSTSCQQFVLHANMHLIQGPIVLLYQMFIQVNIYYNPDIEKNQPRGSTCLLFVHHLFFGNPICGKTKFKLKKTFLAMKSSVEMNNSFRLQTHKLLSKKQSFLIPFAPAKVSTCSCSPRDHSHVLCMFSFLVGLNPDFPKVHFCSTGHTM